MGKLFEIAPGIERSRIFDISDEEIDALDEDSLHRLKKAMAVRYRIRALRAHGPFRDDYLFRLNHPRSIVDAALVKYDMYRQSRTHPLLSTTRIGRVVAYQLAQAEDDLTRNTKRALGMARTEAEI